MLIQVSGGEGSPAEWVLLELQGKLASTVGADTVGRVLCHLRAEDRGLVLRVGSHTVVGHFKELSKALHVMQREESADGSAKLIVRCIVRRKLLFTARPQPILASG